MTTVGMAFPPDVLSPVQRRALDTTGGLLIDDWYEEIQSMTNGVLEPSESMMAAWLPPAFRPRLTVLLAKRFHLCLATVYWKLAQPEWPQLVCLAEELMLHILIEEAQAVLENAGTAEPADMDFGFFEDMAYTDTDFLYLYDPAQDGIHQSPIGDSLRMASLSLDNVFEPYFSGSLGSVHPYCANDDNSDEEQDHGNEA